MKTLFYAIVLTAFLCSSYSADAQFGKIKSKLKKTVKSETKKSNKSSKKSSSSSLSTNEKTTSKPETTEKEEEEEREYQRFLKDRYYDIRYIESAFGGYGESTEKVLKEATELDYPKTRAYILKKGGSGVNYETVLGYNEEFPVLFNETFKPKISKYLAQANNKKASNMMEAIAEAEKAMNLVKAAKLVLPENEEVIKAFNSTTEAYKEIGGEYFARVYTGNFHIENAGSMVFFNKETLIGEEKKEAVKSSFSHDEYIYAVAYLKGSVKDIFSTKNAVDLSILVLIDGANVARAEETISAAEVRSDKAYFSMEILPNPQNNKQNFPEVVANALAKAAAGEHVVTVRVKGKKAGSSHTKELIKGEFKINCTESAAYFEALTETYHQNNLKRVKFPKAKRNDPALANSIKKVVMKKSWAQGKQVVKVNITDKNWTIKRHSATGRVTHREISAAVAIKSTDGKCKFWNFTFKQPYVGGSYKATELESIGSNSEIAPENIK